MINALKIISLAVILLFAQFSFLSYLSLSSCVDLILIFLFLYVFLSKAKYSYLLAFILGLLIDLFSSYPLGSKTFLYLSLVFILLTIKQNLMRNFGLAQFLLLVFLIVSVFEIIKISFFLFLNLGNGFTLMILWRILINGFLIGLIAFLGRKKLFKIIK